MEDNSQIKQESDSDAFLGLALKRLRGEEPNVILIAEHDEAVRTAVSRMSASLCEGFEVEHVDDSVAAVRILREGLNTRVALILAEVDQRQGINVLIANTRESLNERTIQGMDSVPLIAVFGDDEANGTSGQAATERYLSHGLVDSCVKKPFDINMLKREIAIAISRREGVFHESENRLRPKILREFVEYYKNLIAVWRTDIKNISFFPSDSAAVTPDTREADLVQFWKFIERFKGLLTIMESAGENIDVGTLRKIVHDVNNALSVPFAYIKFILDTNPNDQDRSILTRLQDDTFQLERYLKQISNAYNGRGTWSEIQRSHPELQLRNKLAFPKGTGFLVVDDDEAVRNVARRTIEQSGGMAITVGNKAELQQASLRSGIEGVSVVLLDHRLGDNCYGYELIDPVKAACPGALIIAHTSEADGLNSCPTNPYKEAGVEIVDKRNWNAISGIIRRKLKKSSDVSTDGD